MQRPNINNLEQSATPYSIPRTDATNNQEYIAPGANGQVWTVVAGIPQYATITFPSEFEVYANVAALPVAGVVDVIYYTTAENEFRIWNGAAYVVVPTAASFSFTLAGNSGPNQTISNTDTLSILASRGFTVVASATDTVTVTPPAGTVTGQVMYWNNGTSTWSAVALTGTDVANVPAGNIAATNVQTAINELDTEKQTNIQYQDEGGNLGTSGTVDTVNYVGTGVVASRVGNTVTVTIAAGAGEANTASNVNVGGVGVFKQKTGVDLEFRGINNSNAGVSVTLDNANNEIDLAAVASATAGNIIAIDGTGILAKQVIEYFTPADGATTLTLANTPKAGTPVYFQHGSVTQIPTTDWSIAANIITKVVAFNPSPGGAANAQTASVTYWV